MTTLLRTEARTFTCFMTMIFQFAPLRRGLFLLSRIAVIAGHRGPRRLRGAMADHDALASASAASTEMRRSVPTEKYLSLPLRMSL